MARIHEEQYEHQRGAGAGSRCRIRVYRRPGGDLVIVASELEGELAPLGENPGASITNIAAELATAWRKRYPTQPLTWIEHYPARGGIEGGIWEYGETFDRVRFRWDNTHQCYVAPAWTHLGRTAFEELIAEAWPEPAAPARRTFTRQS